MPWLRPAHSGADITEIAKRTNSLVVVYPTPEIDVDRFKEN